MDVQKVLASRCAIQSSTAYDISAQARSLAICRQDIVFWVNHFCWCYEPREQKEFPMVLYDYQRWALREWVDHLNGKQGDIVVEKARDMGITWCWLYVFVYFWLFRPNTEFMISTFREQDVDNQNDMATLFPKIRYIVDRLPEWMKPEGYNPRKHATYMRQFNPQNRSLIKGSAPIPNFARSGRYLAAFFDELAQWPYGQSSWDSASQSTKIRIALSTPWGRDNCYANLALDKRNIRVPYPGILIA